MKIGITFVYQLILKTMRKILILTSLSIMGCQNENITPYTTTRDNVRLKLIAERNSYVIMKADIDSSSYLIVSGYAGIAIVKHK